jgi:segregation and condensation protein B
MNNIMTPDDCACVEAILFAAGYPVTYVKLAEVFGTTADEIKCFITDIAKNYAGRGIELLTYDDSCRLCTKPQYEDKIKTALGLRRSGTLSVSSLEVLAVIAYNQPVTRAYIEQIRGVDSSYAVGLLSDRGLIESKGRLDVPGRPVLYGTTEAFLRCFGINSLNELGQAENIS